jgi:dephospho-CoA kinase
MIFIGVTGGIGSGKSLVCSFFAQKAIPIFYADEVAKKIIDTEIASKQIAEAFGKQVLDSSGKPNKKKLAEAVFSDQNRLRLLNSIVHPAVFNEFETWKSRQRDRGHYGLAEAALIFESRLDEKLNYVLSVLADEKTRIQRVLARDNSTEGEIIARMKHQLPDEELVQQSDFILYNNKSPEELSLQVNFFHTLFSNLTQRRTPE